MMSTIIAVVLLCLVVYPAHAQVSVHNGQLSTGQLAPASTTQVFTDDLHIVRLTDDPAESSHPRVVVDANYVYVTWQDARDGNLETYWQRFNRLGSPLTEAINVSLTQGSSVTPAIGIDGLENSYIVWLEDPPYGTIYGAKLDKDGSVLDGPAALSPGLCLDPDIAVAADGRNWIVYHRRTVSDQNVYARLSNSDLTEICQGSLNAGTLPAFNKTPAVTVIGGSEAFVAWRDMNIWWQDGIYVSAFSTGCGQYSYRLHGAGDYTRPALGWSGVWPWMVAEKSGNVYNLHGETSASQINDVSGTAAYPKVGDDPDYGFAVWQDVRDGNSEIYLSQAYGATPFPDVRITQDPASSSRPDIATHNPEPGAWWVAWQDARDGNWEIYLASNSYSPQPTSLMVKDRDGNPITSGDCLVTRYRWTGSVRHTEEHTSDTTGHVVFDDLLPGDSVFARRLVWTVTPNGRTDKALHKKHPDADPAESGYFFLTYAENSHSDLSYDVFVPGYADVYLSRQVSRIHLIAAFEYDAGPNDSLMMMNRLDTAASRFWNATNGNFWIDSVTILDDIESTGDYSFIDLLITRGGGPATVMIPYPLDADDATRYKMPDWTVGLSIPEIIEAGGIDTVRSTLSYSLVLPPVRGWCMLYSTPLFDSWTDVFGMARTLSHELGHYMFSLGDENPFCTEEYSDDRASIMSYFPSDEQPIADGIVSEFCHSDNHRQDVDMVDWNSRWAMEYSCWDAIDLLFDGLQIVHSSEEEQTNDVILSQRPRYGVDDGLQALESFSAQLRIIRPDPGVGLESGLVEIRRAGKSLATNDARFSFGIGESEIATAEWIGIKAGDIIRVFSPDYAISEIELLGAPSLPIDVMLTSGSWGSGLHLPDEDRIELILPSSPVAMSSVASTCDIRFNWSDTRVSGTPWITLCRDRDTCGTFLMNAVDDTTFTADIIMDACDTEAYRYLIIGHTDGTDIVLAAGEYATGIGNSYRPAEIEALDRYSIRIPESNFDSEQTVLAYTLLDVPVASSTGLIGQAAPVYVTLGGGGPWTEPGQITADLDSVSVESTVSFLWWAGDEWVPIETSYDSVYGNWYAEVPQDGFYAIAACDCYCHGDPQCDGVTNVIDVVECVDRAFRGGAPIADPGPSCPVETTDVTCDGITTVLDVVRIIDVAFRGGDPAVLFCNPCGP
ncbi:MAG TPA: hypothetical protein VM118_04130 [Acidobacteriota bacterium]|nr:hypothetical protein [Acidobacteriota bacterium]